MLASELEVRAASEGFRDRPGGTNLDCAANRVFKFGVEADDEGPRRERDKDGLGRKGLVDVVVVVVVAAIATAGGQIGPRLPPYKIRAGARVAQGRWWVVPAVALRLRLPATSVWCRARFCPPQGFFVYTH